MSTTSILIVDDHPLVRDGLKLQLAACEDLTICGEAADVATAMQLVREKKPDLVLVDLSLKSGHGLELLKEIKAESPQTKSLVISAFDDSLFAERALKAGAMGYLNKQQVQFKVVEAIRAVMAGQHYLNPEITSRLVGQVLLGNEGRPHGVESLSNREIEVFTMIGNGLATSAIAQQLELSVHTVETYREKIRSKLGLRNGTELMQRAVQWVLENS